MKKKFLLYLFVFSGLVGCAKGHPDNPCVQNSNDAPMQKATLMASDRWIVTRQSAGLVPSGATQRVYKVTHTQVTVSAVTESIEVLHLPSGVDREQLLQQLSQDVDVQHVEPDVRLAAADLPNVSLPSYSLKQWGLGNIGTPQAWAYTQGRGDVVVAVIDSGIDFSHPDLASAKWSNPQEKLNGRDDDGNGFVDDIEGWNFVEDNDRPEPSSDLKNDYHGTHVAGIIAGRYNISHGTSGVAPKVKLMALRFLNGEKSGYTSDAIKAIRYATDKGARIINASFGSYQYSNAMKKELIRARDRGVLFVAAAGNMGLDNDSQPFYPASYGLSNIVSVTASTSQDAWLSGINYGVHSVHIAAPGYNILSTDRGHGYQSRSGSSMATPFVTGVAALMLSYEKQLNVVQVRAGILSSAMTSSRLRPRVNNGRRLDALESLRDLASGKLPTADPGVDSSLAQCGF